MLNFLGPFIPYIGIVLILVIIFIITVDITNIKEGSKLLSKRYMNKKLKEATLLRYQYIMEYALKQAAKQAYYKYPDSLWKMYRDIDTSFNSTFCVYCSIYNEGVFSCKGCPLGKNPSVCCKGIWDKMAHSKSWEEWIKEFKKLIIFITRHGV